MRKGKSSLFQHNWNQNIRDDGGLIILKLVKIWSNILLNLYRWGPYFIEPLVIGLDKVSDTEYKPVIATYDSIGTYQPSETFEVVGTGS